KRDPFSPVHLQRDSPQSLDPRVLPAIGFHHLLDPHVTLATGFACRATRHHMIATRSPYTGPILNDACPRRTQGAVGCKPRSTRGSSIRRALVQQVEAADPAMATPATKASAAVARGCSSGTTGSRRSCRRLDRARGIGWPGPRAELGNFG